MLEKVAEIVGLQDPIIKCLVNIDMKKTIRNKIQYLGLTFFILIFTTAFLVHFNKNLVAIKATAAARGCKVFPNECYFQYDGKEYLIENIYKYNNKKLDEYWFVGSEGFTVQKFAGKNIGAYSAVNKPYIKLHYDTLDNSIHFQANNYAINAKKGDTLFSKIDSERVILFIDKQTH